jgi:hypothetical protein
VSVPPPEDAAGASFEREVDRLYGLPLDQFTAARNARATELRRSGEDEAAKRVRELRKPTRAASAINRAVRRRKADAKWLLGAVDELSGAQERLLEGGGRRSVERAVDKERRAVDKLMAAVEAELDRDGDPSESMLERARNTLHAVATDPELRTEFEAGRITKDHEAVGFGALALTSAAASAAPPRSPERSEARRRTRRAERALELAERSLERARAARAEAEERLEAASAAVERAQEELAEATRERDDAHSSLERAS